MKTEINEVEINGVKYIPKGEGINGDGWVIVRCETAGVFLGKLSDHNPQTGVCKLNCARRLWYWSGAASLSQLAIDGTNKPKECKFPVSVPEITVAKVIEVIPCTPKAVESLTEVPVWKA